MSQPLVPRLADFLRSQEGQQIFWCTVAACLIGRWMWNKHQQAKQTTNSQASLSLEEQAEIRRRRFERLQQQTSRDTQKQQPERPSSSSTSSVANTKSRGKTNDNTKPKGDKRNKSSVIKKRDDKSDTTTTQAHGGSVEQRTKALPSHNITTSAATSESSSVASAFVVPSSPLHTETTTDGPFLPVASSETATSAQGAIRENEHLGENASSPSEDTEQGLSDNTISKGADAASNRTLKSQEEDRSSQRKTKKSSLSKYTPAKLFEKVLLHILFKDDQRKMGDSCSSLDKTLSNQIPLMVPPPNATWEDIIQHHWPAVLQSSTMLPCESVQQALTWLHRIRDAVEYVNVSNDDEKVQLKTCFDSLFRQKIMRRLVQRLWEQAQKEETVGDADQHDADFELGALFSDDYGDIANSGTVDSSIGTTHECENNPLVDFLVVLEGIETPVSSRVMQDMYAQQPTLPRILLQKAIHRIPSIDPSKGSPLLSDNDILRPLTALSNLVTLSTEAAKEFRTLLLRQVEQQHVEPRHQGLDIEQMSVLQKLMPLAALSVPNLGQETGTMPPSSYFPQRLRQQVENFPVAVFMKNQSSIQPILNDTRRVMQRARDLCTSILKRIMKVDASLNKEQSNTHPQRQCLFRWLSIVLQANEPNVYVLASDLLRSEGPQQSCSSRKFLLGTAATMVNFCVDALCERYNKLGLSAFDPNFLIHSTSGLIVEGERTLLAKNDEGSASNQSTSFAGSTEFFFLSTALLRVALFPGIRAEQELNRQYGPLFNDIRRVGERLKNVEQVPANLFDDRCKASVEALLGWETTLQDPEFIRTVTTLSILQLKWLAALAEDYLRNSDETNSRNELGKVPEWFLKLPSEWIATVATRSPKHLSVVDGETAVECATRLLSAGTRFPGQDFSPPAMTELIRIPGAFIRAGVARARASVMMKHAASLRRLQENERQVAMQNFVVDERECNVDIALDRNGLGTTAFTNTFVQRHLSSTLISTFSALDAVEGINIEREHAFDKFHVKGEVAELLLRLWNHPSGGASHAVAGCAPDELSIFVSSLVSAIGLQLDDSCLKLLDIREVLKKSASGQLPRRDVQYFDHMAKTVAAGFAAGRKLLRLLMCILEHDKVAALFGGNVAAGRKEALPVTQALANLFLSLMERLSSEGGKMNTELDFHSCFEDDVDSNGFLRAEFGLDVGVLVHFLMAIAARLHSASTQSSSLNHGSPLFTQLVAENEDCTGSNLQAVLGSLVFPANTPKGSEAVIQGTTIDSQRRWCIAQDQITHAVLESVAKREEIEMFVDAVKAAETNPNISAVSTETLLQIEQRIIDIADHIEEAYGDALGEWTISSESFETTSGSVEHFYHGLAKKRTNVASAKALQIEARKTKKLLPDPVASAAIFLCFAEERMDVCKAVITGPESTPYSLGLFVFDLFFPAMYPSVPPLITFLTTGGGQVRFSPNLYNDGKVCISLLGTAHAWNAAQQWNEDSSLAQVLLSIQTQILGVNDPYFSEGFGHSNTKGTPEGEAASARYNNKLRLATLRHAVIDHLKSPPRGFEEVTLRHFSLCRKRLLVQARRWMVEAKGTPIHERFKRAYKTLLSLLVSDRLSTFDGYNGRTLAPLDDDLQCLRNLDPDFVKKFFPGDEFIKNAGAQDGFKTMKDAEEEGFDVDQKVSTNGNLDPVVARTLTGILVQAAALRNNPWANGSETSHTSQEPTSNADNIADSAIEDEEDMYS